MTTPVVAKSIRLDPEAVQVLRKDFLTLTKNIGRVQDYRQADALRDAFKVFRKRFNRIFFDEFINRQLKYDETISESTREWHEKQLRKSGWDFYLGLEVPLPYVNEYYTAGAAYTKFTQERRTWENRLKGYARVLWKALDSFLADIHRPHYDIPLTEVHDTEVEGFKVRVIGDLEAQYAGDWDRFVEGLRIFRQRAAKVLPAMLRLMLPIHAKAMGDLDEGGRYERKHIMISLTGFSEHKNPGRMAHVVAHEMGHHLYSVYLGENDREFWSTAIRGNYGPIDVEKALRLWPEGAWLYEMDQKLKDVDPTLAIQLDLLHWGHGARTKLNTREDFERAVASGEKLNVPQNPISGYAGKSPEEAFCEAIGTLVGYGPRTVDPLVLHWLQMILPSLRVASERVADRVATRFALVQRIAARFKSKKKTDAGNTVYLYSERQIANRNKQKAERIQKLSGAIKKLRAKVKKDLRSSDPEIALTALAVALMDHTYERVGNPESADEGHFGVTGWKRKHVSFKPSAVFIKYVGKSGVKQEKKVTDAAIRSALKDAYDAMDGEDTGLLEWDGGKVSATKVNEYLEPFNITAKDIRGFHANEEMRVKLKSVRAKGKLPEDKKEREKLLKDEFKEALEQTAKCVGHEASTLRSQYLVPGLEENFIKDGTIIDKFGALVYDDGFDAYVDTETDEAGPNGPVDPPLTNCVQPARPAWLTKTLPVVPVRVCPFCSGPYTRQCRCSRSDMACANGHEWHYQGSEIHAGESDHGSTQCCSGPAIATVYSGP